jgi:CPA1 family monovalent cation:H+ antiporter
MTASAASEPFAALAITSFLAVFVAAWARNRGVGMALPLVGLGAILSLLPLGPNAPTDSEIYLVAVLAPLVFGEALSTSYLDIRKVSRPVLVLAIGLVVVSAFTVGFVAAAVVPAMPLAVALCLGAILGPTDAVAVSAVARQAGLPRRLVTVLEGESLVNDGTALTLLRVATVAAVAGSVTAGEVVLTLVESVLGGILVGAVGGLLLVTVLRRSRDTVAGNGLLLVAPFALYIGAEAVGGSGILAVVVAGLMVAHGTASDPRFRGRAHIGSVWRQITFVLQAMAFVLVGVELPDTIGKISDDERRWLLALVLLIALVLAVTRALFVAAVALLARSEHTPGATGGTFRLREWAVVAWAGARGPISGLAAFSLPLTISTGAPFPERDLVLATTMGVIVVTLILAPTLGPLAHLLKVPADDEDDLLRRVRLATARASLDRLEEISLEAERAGEPLPERAVSAMREAAVRRLDRATELVDDPGGEAAPTDRQRLLREMMRAEQEELVRLRDEEGLPDSVMRAMLLEIDTRRRALEQS